MRLTSTLTAIGALLEPQPVLRFDLVDIGFFEAAFMAGMEMHRQEIAAITAQTEPPTFANTCLPYENAGRAFGRVANMYGTYTLSMNDERMQVIEKKLG